MTEFIPGTVASEIESTERRAPRLIGGFETLLIETGYSIPRIKELIRQFGVACLDIEYGVEIPCFLTYNPQILFATEPISAEWGREQLISSVLTVMAEKSPKIKVIREERNQALTKIQQEVRGKLGLITWLNIFDDGGVGKKDLMDLIQQSGYLLNSGGLFVCSFIEKENSRQRLLEILASTDFPGLKMKYHKSPNPNVAGSLFLIAEKVG